MCYIYDINVDETKYMKQKIRGILQVHLDINGSNTDLLRVNLELYDIVFDVGSNGYKYLMITCVIINRSTSIT